MLDTRRFGFRDVAERAPRNRLVLPADRILRAGGRKIEVERDAREREVRKIPRGEQVPELIVGIEQNEDGEVRLIAEDAAYGEARGRRIVQRRGASAAVEAPQVNRAVRLQFVDCFRGHGFL